MHAARVSQGDRSSRSPLRRALRLHPHARGDARSARDRGAGGPRATAVRAFAILDAPAHAARLRLAHRFFDGSDSNGQRGRHRDRACRIRLRHRACRRTHSRQTRPHGSLCVVLGVVFPCWRRLRRGRPRRRVCRSDLSRSQTPPAIRDRVNTARRTRDTAVTRLRSVVFAYHSIGVACLEELLSTGDEVGLVVTHADRPDESVWWPSVRDLAQDRGVPVLEDADVRSTDLAARVRAYAPDFLFSFMYRTLLPGALLEIPHRGALNLHPSALPKYRGRSP